MRLWAVEPGAPAASGYDNAGNMVTGNQFSLTQKSLTYDAEERMTDWPVTTSGATVTVSFTYDGDGRRVTKTTAAGTTVYVYDPAGRRPQWRGRCI